MLSCRDLPFDTSFPHSLDYRRKRKNEDKNYIIAGLEFTELHKCRNYLKKAVMVMNSVAIGTTNQS